MSKHAFIFGSNYKGTQYELSACVKDCVRISNEFTKRGYVINKNWSENPLNWWMLNINFQKFLGSLKSGDFALIYYSGHGFQVIDDDSDETDNKDECIYISEKLYITDDNLRESLQSIASGVNVLLVFDCCNSGTIADLSYKLNNLSSIKENTFTFKANIVSISGCPDPNYSYEANGTGLLTDSFLKTLDLWEPKIYPSFPWIDFYIRVSSHLLDVTNNEQFPQLAFSNPDILKTCWL